jgi:hypothetical protein
VQVLHDRGVNGHERIDPLHRDPPTAVDPRLVGIHLRDHSPRGLHRRKRDVHRYAQAAHAVLVGWGDLYKRDIEGQQSAPEHRRNIR